MADLDKSQFNICSSFTLSWDDINCLVLLYQPIIGSEAMSLYFTFNSLISRANLESNPYDHIFLYDMLNINGKKFLSLRRILEAIGLIVSYKNDDGYVYLLSAPLSPKKFFSDGVLGLMLYSKVGEEVFNSLRANFKVAKIDKARYQNVTVSFDDVFNVDDSALKVPSDGNYLMNKKPSRNIKISNYSFDMNAFLHDIDQSHIETGVTESFKAKILETAKVYSFDEGDMAGLFIDSLDSSGYFNDKLLKKKAKVYYNFKYKKDIPTFDYSKEVNTDEAMLAIENSTGEEFLKSILGKNYKSDDLNTLNELNNSLNLNPSVIKIMVMHVIRILKEKGPDDSLRMPPKSYFKKVADDWILEGTTDVYTAYNKYVLGVESPAKKKKGYKKSTPAPARKKDKYEIENAGKDVMEGMEVL